MTTTEHATLAMIAECGNGEIIRYKGNLWTYRECPLTEKGRPTWCMAYLSVIRYAEEGLLRFEQLPGQRRTSATLAELGLQRARKPKG